MKRTPFIATLLATAALTVGLLATHAALADKPDGKGKPPKDDPPQPVLPNVRYKIEPLLVAERYTHVRKMNNLGMIVGWVSETAQSDDLHAFMYDCITGVEYNFDERPLLILQLVDLLGPDWHFKVAHGINELGDIVGSVQNESGNRRGFLIETSSSPWIVQLLPDLGSESYGWRINNNEDNKVVLGKYLRPDTGEWDVYLYDTTMEIGPENPIPLGFNDVRNAQLNDSGQVAGAQRDGIAFLYTPDLGIQVFDEAFFRDVNGLNDSGVFSGIIRVRGKVGSAAFRYTNQLEPILTGAVATWGFINASNDVLAADFGSGTYGANYLAHTGFDPEYDDQLLNLHDLIDETDPLRGYWINNWHRIDDLADRDATGYSRMVGHVSDGGSQCGVVLTPFIIPD